MTAEECKKRITVNEIAAILEEKELTLSEAKEILRMVSIKLDLDAKAKK